MPPYSLAPDAAAAQHWAAVKGHMPAEVTAAKDQIWIEVINEPDQTKCAWLANFSVSISKLAVAEGWRIFNIGWSTGTPFVNAGGGPNCYEDPATLALLQYAADTNKAAGSDTVGIAVHEYANSMNITNEWPYLLGRLHYLFDACDAHGIARPPVAITEWGWTACDVKLPPQQGIADIDQIMRGMGDKSYANWAPQLRAAMMWYLGPWSCPVSSKADQLVLPVANYTISSHQ